MQEGRQEDAQEFLGFLLNTLHDELFSLIEKHDHAQDAVDGQASKVGDALNGLVAEDDGWVEVGTGGRTATTRTVDLRPSPITRMFGGKTRSVLRVVGQKDSATVVPFLPLQLDIEAANVDIIEDALSNMSAPERSSDYAREASVSVYLETFPPVLILHLKRFRYDKAGGASKIHKVIGFGPELEINPSVMSSSKRSARSIKYSLSGVIYHHGRSATGGHYTVSLKQQDGHWINIDDTNIRPISLADVAIDRTQEILRLSLPSSGTIDSQSERTAYLLFWTRQD